MFCHIVSTCTFRGTCISNLRPCWHYIYCFHCTHRLLTFFYFWAWVPGRTQTRDTAIMWHVLYPLNHQGAPTPNVLEDFLIFPVMPLSKLIFHLSTSNIKTNTDLSGNLLMVVRGFTYPIISPVAPPSHQTGLIHFDNHDSVYSVMSNIGYYIILHRNSTAVQEDYNLLTINQQVIKLIQNSHLIPETKFWIKV